MVRRNTNVNPMAMAKGIATGPLSSERKTRRPTRKEVRPRMRITGREVNIRFLEAERVHVAEAEGFLSASLRVRM